MARRRACAHVSARCEQYVNSSRRAARSGYVNECETVASKGIPAARNAASASAPARLGTCFMMKKRRESRTIVAMPCARCTRFETTATDTATAMGAKAKAKAKAKEKWKRAALCGKDSRVCRTRRATATCRAVPQRQQCAP